MNELVLRGLDASDPLGFLAALGTLRIVSGIDPTTRLRWERHGRWCAVLGTSLDLDLVQVIETDLVRWRQRHPALDFAVGADRKIQDLKHPPDEFRTLMRKVAGHAEAASFIAAYATGVAVDGSGQTKPTSLHLTAGQQRFLDAVLDIRKKVTREDLNEALFGPWKGRFGAKDTRWRAASERSRALLSFDPGPKRKKTGPFTVVGAVWLAYQGMPFLPTAPSGPRVVTTAFTGRGKHECFSWPIWAPALTKDEVRVLVGMRGLEGTTRQERAVLGIPGVFRSRLKRSGQGLGSFSAAEPV